MPTEPARASEPKPDAERNSSVQLASKRTRWALQRTALAEDRTLMAWVRTAIGLIGFGFTIFTVFRSIPELEPEALPVVGPFELGLGLTAMGTLALGLATWEYRRAMRELRAAGGPGQRWTTAVAAGFVVLVGILVFIALVVER